MERPTHLRGAIFWAREPDVYEWRNGVRTGVPECLNHCSLLPTVNVMGMTAASPCHLAFRTVMDSNLELGDKQALPSLSCSCQPCIFSQQQEMKLRPSQLPEGSCLGPIPHLGQTLVWHRLPENQDRGHGAHEIHPAPSFEFFSKLHHLAHLLPLGLFCPSLCSYFPSNSFLGFLSPLLHSARRAQSLPLGGTASLTF